MGRQREKVQFSQIEWFSNRRKCCVSKPVDNCRRRPPTKRQLLIRRNGLPCSRPVSSSLRNAQVSLSSGISSLTRFFCVLGETIRATERFSALQASGGQPNGASFRANNCHRLGFKIILALLEWRSLSEVRSSPLQRFHVIRRPVTTSWYPVTPCKRPSKNC